MALIPIVASGDGPRITVNQLVNNPRVIPRRILDLMDNQFIADSILRDGGNTTSGAVEYSQSMPLFANEGTAIRSEFGEYKLVQTSDGTPMVVTTVDRGLAIRVSDEMRRRNQVDRVNIQMTQVKNTVIRDWDLAFQTAILNGVTQIIDVSATRPWAARGTATIRIDIEQAKKTIKTAVTGLQSNNYLGFVADTIVMGPDAEFDITTDPTFNNVFQGNISDENLLYTGKLPNQILNLDPLVSVTWPAGYALICERNTIGFISDEQPLQATPLYRQEEQKCWRSDVNRQSAIALDQPLAGCLIKFA
jgi:hypothetical protein